MKNTEEQEAERKQVQTAWVTRQAKMIIETRKRKAEKGKKD